MAPKKTTKAARKPTTEADRKALAKSPEDEMFTFTPEQQRGVMPDAHIRRDGGGQSGTTGAPALTLPILPDFSFSPYMNEEETFDRSKAKNSTVLNGMVIDEIQEGSNGKGTVTHDSTRRTSTDDGKGGSSGSASIDGKQNSWMARLSSAFTTDKKKGNTKETSKPNEPRVKEEGELPPETFRSRMDTNMVVWSFAARVWFLKLVGDLWEAITTSPQLVVKAMRWFGRQHVGTKIFNSIEHFMKDRRDWTATIYLIAVAVFNGLFGVYIYYTVKIWTEPHEYRTSILTKSSSRRSGFTQTVYFIGSILFFFNSAIILELLKYGERYKKRHPGFTFTNMFKSKSKKAVPATASATTGTAYTTIRPGAVTVNPPRKSNDNPCIIMILVILAFCLFVFPMVSPIILASVIPPQIRKQVWANSCPAEEWDYSVTLNARYDMSKEWGKAYLTIYDRNHENAYSHYVTKYQVYSNEFVNSASVILLPNGTSPNFEPKPIIKQVEYRLPYAITDDEYNRWPSNADNFRQTYGNYTITLNNGTTLIGQFPYLDDSDGLRMPEMGLIPDIARPYRGKVYKDCLDGADAWLYEQADITSRTQEELSEDRVVLKTGMNKYKYCAQKVVCAKKRRHVLKGSPWADGEEGKELLDRLLVVPLGVLLIEQVRFGACCGDGWPETTSTGVYI